jgi:Rieske Fe-S protein
MGAEIANVIEKVLSDDNDVREATSGHQANFPYDREAEAQVTRREFCNFLVLTSSALLAASGGFAAKSFYDRSSMVAHAPAKIEGAMSLEPGSALNFFYPTESDSAILVRTASGDYYAYDQKCTHLTCPVYFAKERGRLECPCHEGGFDAATGNVLYGPPPRPLDRIELELRGNEVWAIGKSRGGMHERAE